jgi:hypothetical protein
MLSAGIVPILEPPASAKCELHHARVPPGRPMLEVMRFGPVFNHCWDALGGYSACRDGIFRLVATAIDVLRPIVL